MHLPRRTGDADSRNQLAGGRYLDAGVDDEADHVVIKQPS
jgi:hypothetical protein